MNCLHTAIGAHPRRCLLLLVTTSLVLSGCWNQNYSRDRWGIKPPTRPRSETPNSPDWIPSGLETKDGDAVLAGCRTRFRFRRDGPLLPRPMAMGRQRLQPYPSKPPYPSRP